MDTSDPVLASFEQQKKSTNSKVDKRLVQPWSMVQRIDKQVLRRRSRRAVLPPTSGKLALEAAQSSLGIQDPGFMKQWHLVIKAASHARRNGAEFLCFE
jgi:kexin